MFKYILKTCSVLALLLSTLLFTRCNYDYFVPVEVELPDTVSFTQDLVPIFTQECAMNGCHASGGIPPELNPENAYLQLTLLGYADSENPEASILYQRITSATKPMPPSEPLTAREIQLILAWMKQGAQDN